MVVRRITNEAVKIEKDLKSVKNARQKREKKCDTQNGTCYD